MPDSVVLLLAAVLFAGWLVALGRWFAVKKSDQIKALQAECDRLAEERDYYRKELGAAYAEAKARRDPPSLADQARSEFRQKWEWLLELTGTRPEVDPDVTPFLDQFDRWCQKRWGSDG